MCFWNRIILNVLLFSLAQNCLDFWKSAFVVKFWSGHIFNWSHFYRTERVIFLFGIFLFWSDDFIIKNIVKQFFWYHWFEWISAGMGYFEDLFWTLPKFVYLALETHSLDWISDLFNVDHSFIGWRMEHVTGLDGLLTLLLITEN